VAIILYQQTTAQESRDADSQRCTRNVEMIDTDGYREVQDWRRAEIRYAW
jgi:hypothetical protein